MKKQFNRKSKIRFSSFFIHKMLFWALSMSSTLLSFIIGLQTRRLKSKIHKFFPEFALGSLLGANFFLDRNKTHRVILFSALALSTIVGRSFQMVGLTGGIACGKSMVTHRLLSEFPQVGVIDCDLISREIVRPGRRA